MPLTQPEAAALIDHVLRPLLASIGRIRWDVACLYDAGRWPDGAAILRDPPGPDEPVVGLVVKIGGDQPRELTWRLDRGE